MAGLRFRVFFAPGVGAQMTSALRWWAAHRPAAPAMLLDEIDGALDLVSQAPAAGRRVVLKGRRNVRRVLLRRTRYHLYYAVDFDQGIVQLVAFRHAGRRPVGG